MFLWCLSRIIKNKNKTKMRQMKYIFSNKRTTSSSTHHLICFLALFYFSHLFPASSLLVFIFVPPFHVFCSKFILKSIGQATMTLGCRPGRSHCRALTTSTRANLPHLLHSFISRFISNSNFKSHSILLTSFQSYEVT